MSRWSSRLGRGTALGPVLDAFAELNVTRFHIGDSKNISTVTLAQVIRLYAAWLPGVSASDYLLTSDADIWPIAPRGVYHFNSARNWSAKKVHLYNAFCCGLIQYHLKYLCLIVALLRARKKIMRLNTKMYPIGYIGMQARHWRDVMGNSEAITGRSSLSFPNSHN